MAWFGWDDYSNEVREYSKDKLDEMLTDEKWKRVFQYENGVIQRQNDRHIALEVECDSHKMAVVKFQVVSVEFRNIYTGRD